MTSSITHVASIVSEGAAAMEAAFLTATDGLSLGMTAIGTVVESLRTLAGELDDGAAASASRDVGRLSTTLRGLAARLPHEGEILADLLAENDTIARRFDDLVGEMRMMVVVSRSARLEAVGSEEQRDSLEAFSRAIDGEIGDIQRKVDACGSEHAGLTKLLQRAAQAHLSLEVAFRDRIENLADGLDAATLTIASRREAGLRCVEDAAERGRAVSLAVASALVSLQVGDATRQRLEHVSSAFAHAGAVDGGDDPHAGAIVDLFRGVGQVQLRDTVAAFGLEGTEILQTFDRLGREAASLAEAGRSTYGDSGAGSSSFMQDFRTRLAAAGDIVGACDATRSAVALAASELQGTLHTLENALTSLRATCEDLVTVALNVGLRAVRLGSRGRGLVVVAGELERLADRISTLSQTLLATFRSVRQIAQRFEETGGWEATGPARLGDEMGAILDGLGAADDRIAGILAAVSRTGCRIDATVAGATQALTSIIDGSVRLVAAADRLGAVSGPSRIAEATKVAAIQTVDDIMSALYSMARERDIHAAFVRSFPWPDVPALAERAA